jgi:hypothetical protein
MPCEECRDLRTHRFSSHTDLVNALQVAAGEIDRGVLAPVPAADRSVPEQIAIRSALESGAFPDVVHYRFRCTVCGDAFELAAGTSQGNGHWSRNGEQSTGVAETPVSSKIYKKSR